MPDYRNFAMATKGRVCVPMVAVLVRWIALDFPPASAADSAGLLLVLWQRPIHRKSSCDALGLPRRVA